MSFEERYSPLIFCKARSVSMEGESKTVYVLGIKPEAENHSNGEFLVKSIGDKPKNVGKSARNFDGENRFMDFMIFNEEGVKIEHKGIIYESVTLDDLSEMKFWSGVFDIK